jgi:hypothetical protein
MQVGHTKKPCHFMRLIVSKRLGPRTDTGAARWRFRKIGRSDQIQTRQNLKQLWPTRDRQLDAFGLARDLLSELEVQ